ncbi:MAG: translation initiation factor IF-3 [Myxococcales bacterium]|nr:translation initiation factor IF-3 [Myxococcales bacterium]
MFVHLKKGDQTISKEKEKEPRINARIRVKEVRLIGGDGEQIGIVPTLRALQMAEEQGLDLVEVAETANPPVCKLMDYGKFKYQQKQKAKEARKNATQVQIKEVQLRPKTDDHDLEFKVNHILRFLEEGDKAKITVKFRGREIAHKDRGMALIEKVIQTVGEEGVVESPPRMEGRTMIAIIAPKKK